MFSLFFSTKGRLKRLPYFGLSVLVGVIVIFAMVAVLFLIWPGGVELTPENATQVTQDVLWISGLLLAVYLLGAWMQTCLVFKRCRDFSGNTTFAKIYTALLVGPIIISFIVPTLASVLYIVAIIPLFIMGLVLLFKRSKEGQVDEQSAEVFGERNRSNPMQETNIGISGDTDLVARAAQLRADEEARATASQAAKPAARRPANTGFGRRTGAPAFGNR